MVLIRNISFLNQAGSLHEKENICKLLDKSISAWTVAHAQKRSGHGHIKAQVRPWLNGKKIAKLRYWWYLYTMIKLTSNGTILFEVMNVLLSLAKKKKNQWIWQIQAPYRKMEKKVIMFFMPMVKKYLLQFRW